MNSKACFLLKFQMKDFSTGVLGFNYVIGFHQALQELSFGINKLQTYAFWKLHPQIWFCINKHLKLNVNIFLLIFHSTFEELQIVRKSLFYAKYIWNIIPLLKFDKWPYLFCTLLQKLWKCVIFIEKIHKHRPQ